MPSKNKKILVVLPSPLMARNFLHSGVLQFLDKDNDVIIVSPNSDDVLGFDCRWIPIFHPRRTIIKKGMVADILRWGRYLRYLSGLLILMSLTYRFNSIHEFRGFAGRLKQSWSLRRRCIREAIPLSSIFGYPFSKSKLIFKILRRVYYSKWQSFGPVNRLFAEIKPNLLVLSMIQTHSVTPYALAAINQSVPILGINGSWDHPTTKGPVCPGLERIIVQNEIVRDELIRYHDISVDRIVVVGWLQMDIYAKDVFINKCELYKKIGLPVGTHYILFAANPERLGPHEPDLVRRLSACIGSGYFGPNLVLLCRCHPNDRNWNERWGWANALPSVIVEPPDLGPLEHLASVIKHSTLVIASAGSINLDAIALDVPTIGISWEEKTIPYWDRAARYYELEHLAELRSSNGIAFAQDMPTLIIACSRYLKNAKVDAEGRALCRKRYLHPLDGRAANRLANEIDKILVGVESV